MFAGCTWQGKACQLVVNHEDGFALYAAGARGGGNGMSPSSSPTPLWRRSFDKLKMSADDGARLLWLDFGGEDGEIVSVTRMNPSFEIRFLPPPLYRRRNMR